jgi:hypothetical protein
MGRVDTERDLAQFVASCHHDPLRFVVGAYPWGEPGFLKAHDGPDTWQAEFLRWWGDEIRQRSFDGHTPVAPIRAVVSSGHGIGKSVLVAMIVDFIMSTRPFSQGTCTANTITQLQTKTWAAVKRWTKMCLTGHWFIINDERMYHPDHKESWFCALQNSKKENAEAFAGQHAADATSFYVVDESSAIDDAIFETAEGGLTDGEPMIFQFGNPTRSYGHFHRCAFGAGRTRWTPTIIDSRTSRFTNKTQIAEWIEDYGIDSDFVRVRVRGLPPSASDVQYIGLNLVTEAQRRPVALLGDEPLVCGLDVARGGDDNCVFYFRRGADARSIPPIRIPGEKSRDSTRVVSRAAEVLDSVYDGQRVAHLFVDGTGIGGPIVDRLKQLNYKNVTEVQFGGDSPDPQLANMRAYIWSRMRDWLQARGAIPGDVTLETDLTGPGYHHDNQDRLVLESKEQMKKRGVSSPDDGDALALTFAGVVGADRQLRQATPRGWVSPAAGGNWMA